MKKRFNTQNFPEQKKLTKDDYVIICGDFGGIWNFTGESKSEKYALDLLSGYPRKVWKNGYVRELRPSVLMLERGYVFDINGKKCFAFGGASSNDITAGILKPENYDTKEDAKKEYKKLDEAGLSFRVNQMI